MQSLIEEKDKSTTDLASPYYMFKLSVRSETTRKYYERTIIRFFDFIEFDSVSDAEERCNQFAEKSRNMWTGF